MLVLRRRKNESILIGKDIRITIIECTAEGVRIAINAPKEIPIIREELAEAEQMNKTALAPKASSVRTLQAALKKKFDPPKNDGCD